MAQEMEWVGYTDPDTGKDMEIEVPVGSPNSVVNEAIENYRASQEAHMSGLESWVAASEREYAREQELDTGLDRARGFIRGYSENLQTLAIDVPEALGQMWPGGESPLEAFQQGPGKGTISGFVKKQVAPPKSMAGKSSELVGEYGPLGLLAGWRMAVFHGNQLYKGGVRFLDNLGEDFTTRYFQKAGKPVTKRKASQAAAKEIEAGKTVESDALNKAAQELNDTLGPTRVIAKDKNAIMQAVTDGEKYSKNLMKRMGVKEAFAEFEKEGSLRAMWALEKALEEHIPKVASKAWHKAYINIKRSIRQEVKGLMDLADDQAELLRALGNAKKKANALQTYKDKVFEFMTVFKDNDLVRKMGEGKLPKVIDKALDTMMSGPKADASDIEAVMKALSTQGKAGLAAQRQLGLSHWVNEFQPLFEEFGELAMKDELVRHKLATLMLRKIRALGPDKMTALHPHLPDLHAMRFLERQLHAVTRKMDPGPAKQWYRKHIAPQHSGRSRFLDRLGMHMGGALTVAAGMTLGGYILQKMGILGAGAGKAQSGR